MLIEPYGPVDPIPTEEGSLIPTEDIPTEDVPIPTELPISSPRKDMIGSTTGCDWKIELRRLP
jgi:hypothetical protein